MTILCRYSLLLYNSIFVFFLSPGSFQLMHGDALNLSQPSLSRIIASVATEIARWRERYIIFPSTNEKIRAVQEAVYEYCGFPGVIGCIDCTHVHIRNPGGEVAHLFVNRKRRYSINVQVRVYLHTVYSYTVRPQQSQISFLLFTT